MQEQTNTSRVVTKKDQDGELDSITIDGIGYILFRDGAVAIPESVIASVNTAQFPKDVDVMLLDEKGEAFLDTHGINPISVILANDKKGIVSCEVNLCRNYWNSTIEYVDYCKALLKLFELPEQVKESRRKYLI